MTATPYPRLADWIEHQLADRDWTVTDLANATGLNRSGIQRWKSGSLRPDIDNARRLAAGFGRPLIEVLIAAELVTPEEAKQKIARPIDLGSFGDEQLLAEVRRRMGRGGGERKAPSREEIDANPDRYSSLTGGQRGRGRKRG